MPWYPSVETAGQLQFLLQYCHHVLPGSMLLRYLPGVPLNLYGSCLYSAAIKQARQHHRQCNLMLCHIFVAVVVLKQTNKFWWYPDNHLSQCPESVWGSEALLLSHSGLVSWDGRVGSQKKKKKKPQLLQLQLNDCPWVKWRAGLVRRMKNETGGGCRWQPCHKASAKMTGPKTSVCCADIPAANRKVQALTAAGPKDGKGGQLFNSSNMSRLVRR